MSRINNELHSVSLIVIFIIKIVNIQLKCPLWFTSKLELLGTCNCLMSERKNFFFGCLGFSPSWHCCRNQAFLEYLLVISASFLDKLVYTTSTKKAAIRGEVGVALTGFEALSRVGLIDPPSLLTAGFLQVTEIFVGGIISPTHKLLVCGTVLNTLTVCLFLFDNTMSMEGTEVDVTWS